MLSIVYNIPVNLLALKNLLQLFHWEMTDIKNVRSNLNIQKLQISLCLNQLENLVEE